MNKKATDEKRAELRFHIENGIAYGFLNKAEQYVGIAKDVSRDGMFFLSSRQLKPGSILRIQPLDCQAATPPWQNRRGRRLADALCADPASSASSRKFFANMVTAEVKRCQIVDETTTWRYGIGVNFLRPTV